MYRFLLKEKRAVRGTLRPLSMLCCVLEQLRYTGCRSWIMKAKLTIFILLVSLMHLSATTNAQQITLTMRDAELTHVLSAIKAQSGYDFVIYTGTALNKVSPISISVRSMELDLVLKKIFEGQPLTYQLDNKTIVIREKPKISRSTNNIIPENQQTIRGRVVDENGQPLVGVTIYVLDQIGQRSNRQVLTNREGLFEFTELAVGTILELSYLGHTPRREPAKNQMGTIILRPVAVQMESIEIVSTGYQNIPKERATGSFGIITEKDLEKRGSINLLERIEGTTSGLLVNVGAPDRSLAQGRDNFSIRGISTINSEKKPLIVLDGFPTELDLVNINPDNIASITTLKDAAAASIWGVRAANGVLVIESKKGKVDRAQVEFSSILNLSGRPRLEYMPVLDAANYIALEKELVDKDLIPSPASPLMLFQPPLSRGSELALRLKKGTITQQQYDAEVAQLATIDVKHQYQKYLLRTPFSQQYNLAVSGGSAHTRNRLAVSYTNEQPNAQGDHGNRFSISFSNQTQLSSKLLFTGESFLTLLNQKNNGIGLRAFQPSNNNLLPYDQIVDAHGNPNDFTYQVTPHVSDSLAKKGFLPWNYNYLDELTNADNTFRSLSYRVVTGLKYTVAPALSFEAKYMLEKEVNKGRNYYNPSTYFARNIINSYTTVDTHVKGIPQGGVLDLQDIEQNNYSLRGQMNFSPNFGTDHRMDMVIGAEIRETFNSGYSNRAYGYDDRLLTSAAIPNYTLQYKTVFGNRQVPFLQGFDYAKDRYISAFGNFNYTFKERYALSGSFRKDDSNLFGASSEFRSVPLWSVGAMWRSKEEAFMSALNWLNTLNVRTTAGYNGNVNKTTSPYLIIQPVSAAASPLSSGGNFNSDPFATVFNPSNPMLRWERVRTFNAGIDFAAFDNRISGSVDAYWRKSLDLLGRVEINPTYGYTNTLANQLEMSSQGVDIELKAVAIKKADFSWQPGFNLSFNKNEVTKAFFQQNTTSYYTNPENPIEGHQLGSIFTYKYAHLNANGNAMIYNGKGEPVLSDLTSFDETDIDALTYKGVTMPRYYGGLSNSIRYRDFELYLLFTFKGGHKFVRPTIDYISNLQYSRVAHEDWAYRWQKPGDELITDVPAIDPDHINVIRYYRSDLFVEDASYLRWRDVTLTYRLPVKNFGWKALQSMDISLSGKNIALWTANKHKIDPDYIPTSRTVTLPPAKSFVFAIRTNF